MARTKGSPNVTQLVDVETSRCRNCQSTQRADYTNRRVQEIGGHRPNGTPYSRIVRRNTICLSCGQARIDMTYEYDPPPAVEPAVDSTKPGASADFSK